MNKVNFGLSNEELLALANSKSFSSERQVVPIQTVAAESLQADAFEPTEEKKKPSKLKKAIILTAFTAAILGCSRKFAPGIKSVDLTQTLSNSKGFWQKTKYCIAKTGDIVNAPFRWIKGLFKSNSQKNTNAKTN